MISLDTSLLTQEIGDSRQRHLDYAKRAGHITMIIYSRRAQLLRPAELSPHLTAIPTASRTRPAFVWDAYRLGARAHRERPADVLTTQDPFATGLVGLALRWRFGVPLEVQNHSVFFDNPHFLRERPLRNRPFNRLGKFVIRRADTNRVVNHHEKAKYIALGLDPERIWVIPTPINLDRFLKSVPPQEIAALRARLGLRPEHRVALWVGRPVPVKNLPLLFQVGQHIQRTIPDFRLVLVGDFSRADRLRQQARTLGGTIVFAGRVAHEDLPSYYALCSAYVQSSLYEGMPKVLVEAAATGRPAVCPDIPGAVDAIIDGKTGFVTRPGDPHDLAEKVIRLLQDPDLARRMGEHARQHALRAFDREKHIQAMLEAWRAAAAMGKHSSCEK
jgi:glycosyltransferase involved in cell wall biosynthesis